MTNKQLQETIKRGDTIVKSSSENRVWFRLYRNGRKLTTLTKSQYNLLVPVAEFDKFGVFGNKIKHILN